MSKQNIYQDVARAAELMRDDIEARQDYHLGVGSRQDWIDRVQRNAFYLEQLSVTYAPDNFSVIHAVLRPLREKALRRKVSRRAGRVGSKVIRMKS